MATEKDKSDRSKSNSVKHMPKDAQVIMSILKEMNIKEYEPRIVNQLLEFVYRYTTCVLEDAKVFANHSRKKTIDVEDVKLATELAEQSFAKTTSRLDLSKLAETRNAMTLPPIRPHCGLRLPPDRYCLTACNYKLRSSIHSKKTGKSNFEIRSSLKTQVRSIGPTGSTVLSKRPTSLTSKPPTSTIPKPLIKFTKVMSLDVRPNVASEVATDDDNIKMEVDLGDLSNKSEKLNAEEDDFVVVL